MKKASSSLFLVLLASLFLSVQSFAQAPGRRPAPAPAPMPNQGSQVLREQVNQNLGLSQRLQVVDLFRLTPQEAAAFEVVSLTVQAESLIQGPGELTLSQAAQPIGTEKVRRNLNDVTFAIPTGTKLRGLQLTSRTEIYIASITAEVVRTRGQNPIPNPGPGQDYEEQVAAHSVITLQLNQTIRGSAQLPLVQLTKQQLGVSLKGASIERVVVFGQSLHPRIAANVQVELNRRPVGEVKYLTQERTPLQLQTMEQVQNLALQVNGDAYISEIRIRVGAVTPQYPEMPRIERVMVGQQVLPGRPLEMGRIMGQRSQYIRSVTIEARSLVSPRAQLALVATYGELQGEIFVNNNRVRATVNLRRPMMAHELRFDASLPIMIEALEFQFDSYPY